MKYIKPINEIWGPVLKRDLLGETREEDKFHTKEELIEYLKSEIKKQGENVVIKNLDVSHIEDLSELFRGICLGVKTLDLSGWNTSNVKDMESMIYFCNSLISLDLSGWDTSKVRDMSNMCFACNHLESLDVSGWNTSNVESMNWMFSYCKNLKSLDLSGWDTSNVKDMSGMFYSCECLKSLNLSGWDTSNVYDMIYMSKKRYKLRWKKYEKNTTCRIRCWFNYSKNCGNE